MVGCAVLYLSTSAKRPSNEKSCIANCKFFCLFSVGLKFTGLARTIHIPDTLYITV